VRPGFWQYVRAAFNARPIGMFVPPNWVGLGLFGLLGATVDPGFWVLGAGLEIGYLSLLATHPRFQRFVSGTVSLGAQQTSVQKLQETLTSLPPNDRERYRLRELACQSILQLQFRGATNAPGYEMQAESLGRLTWMYLRLLATRQSIQVVIRGPSPQSAETAPWREARRSNQPPPLPMPPATDSRHLEARLKDLRAQLDDKSLSEDLRRSLTSQAELIQQRLDRRALAVNKLAFIEAELTRIEQQVELIREQAVLSTDPESFSHRIDEIGATLSGTGDWIAEQQRVLGTLDMLAESAPVSTPIPRGKERQ
jgi:hypothetical protein